MVIVIQICYVKNLCGHAGVYVCTAYICVLWLAQEPYAGYMTFVVPDSTWPADMAYYFW